MSARFSQIVEESKVRPTAAEDCSLSPYIPIGDLRDIIFDYTTSIDGHKLRRLIGEEHRYIGSMIEMAAAHPLTRDIKICVIL